MDLIECPTCKKSVSPNATSCPGCGEPINQAPAKKAATKTKRAGVSWEAMGTILIAVGIFIAVGSESEAMKDWAAGFGAVGLVTFIIGRFK